MIEVWTDGSCIPNPGKGGWAWMNKDRIFGSGCENHSTNQRMELKAVIEALKFLPPDEDALIRTDSQFVIKGATIWIRNWIKNGWMTKDKTPVKNRELWEELHSLMGLRVVQFQWVRGHNGDEMNEIVDNIANEATGASYEDRANMNRRISSQKSWKPKRKK